MAEDEAALQVIDLSNPTNCVRVGGCNTSGIAEGVAVAAYRIYVANGRSGLWVLCTLPNVQHMMRVDGTPGVPCTIEVTTNLKEPVSWTPVFTTNSAIMPFEFTDFDVKTAEKPQKFFRARQP